MANIFTNNPNEMNLETLSPMQSKRLLKYSSVPEEPGSGTPSTLNRQPFDRKS
jgi:hypothetical protein